jgi:hypothetical protein
MIWPYIVPVVALIGVFALAIVKTLSRARLRELLIRERIAMIEKGLAPAPETDPGGFDRMMGRYEGVKGVKSNRHRRAGITLIGVGLGLMLLIGVAGGDPSSGFGVGGFIAVLGGAFLLNSFFEREEVPLPSRIHTPPQAPTADVPPGNIPSH